jgi:hypothetical protein
MNLSARRLGPIFAFAFILAALFGVPAIAKADAQLLTFQFSTTNASGTIGPFLPQGSPTCSITFTSGGGATITVTGSANGVAPFQTNANFGTLGIITNPAAGSVYAGNVAAFPMGFAMPFTGNTGTLSGSVTCGKSMVAPVFGYNSAGPQEFMFPDGSFPISVTGTASTTQLIAAVAGKAIYVLGYSVTLMGGTNPTWAFGWSAVANCASGVTNFTGAQGQQGGTSAVFSGPPTGLWYYKVPVGDALCLTAGGTSPSFAGGYQYAQLAGP